MLQVFMAWIGALRRSEPRLPWSDTSSEGQLHSDDVSEWLMAGGGYSNARFALSVLSMFLEDNVCCAG